MSDGDYRFTKTGTRLDHDPAPEWRTGWPTYQTLIEKAKQVYQEGARDLLLDFNGLSYISSAGILALHKTALLFRGVTLADEEEGWESVRAVDRDRSSGVQQHLKLLNPQTNVLHVLDVVGFTAFFEISTDLEEAVASV